MKISIIRENIYIRFKYVYILIHRGCISRPTCPTVRHPTIYAVLRDSACPTQVRHFIKISSFSSISVGKIKNTHSVGTPLIRLR